MRCWGHVVRPANAGFEIVQAYDAWQPAAATYRENVGTHIWKHDLNDIIGVGAMLEQLQPDMICGGPPCQDYSVAGERLEGENASMTKAFAMLVTIARPTWFLMENVDQATKSKAWTEAKAILQRVGYGLTECKLDASYYGVAQARKRLFVIGRLGERDGFLTSALAAARSPRQMTLGDLFGADCPPIFLYPRFRMNKAVWYWGDKLGTFANSYLAYGSLQKDLPQQALHYLDGVADQFNLCR